MNSAENPVIGLDNVYIAKLLNDDGINPPSYDTPVPLKGAVTASVNPNSSVETDFADNGAFFVADNRGNIEISMELTNVDADVLAEMLGQSRQNGITSEMVTDQAPYFAMGFRVWIGGTDVSGNKIYEYFWYAKGKFSVPQTGANTKGESIDFQHKSITAQFVSTLWQPTGNGGLFCTHGRSDKDLPVSVAQNWFNAPVLVPTSDLTDLTFTATKSGTKKVLLTGAKESGTASNIAAGSVKLGQNVLITEDGDEVEGVVSVEDNVITFEATDAFAGTIGVVVTSGVKDVYGVSATPLVTTLA